jgi:3'-phosphoadenosine 5'-phosphosulfate (PAPS) 3'-phosphatase
MKIFGIGLSKTGTTSLAQALTLLGFKTRDYPGLSHYAPGDLSSIDAALLEAFDALTDTPIPSFYRELDARYPDAKFILTVRDKAGWLKSCKKQFTQKLAEKQSATHNQLFMDLYGCTVFDEEKFAAGYDRFVQSVQDHFGDRPGKLLTLDVIAGDGWEKLCPFLNKPVPEAPFPKANVTRIRWMAIDDLVRIAREAGEDILRRDPRRMQNPLRKALYALSGGRPHAVKAATRAAEQRLLTSLAKLNPDIPVVSRLSHAMPYSERDKWNHFWLVDPLDGEETFAVGNGEFTVNIALIEDRRAVAGVVYAPLSGTVFYAMTWKGAYKVEGRGQPVKLEMRDADTPALNHPQSASRPARPTPGSRALEMCRLVENEAAIAANIMDTMEWQSAAAHALANSLGRRILQCDTTAELSYNKENWINPCITVA